jgi:hypothetical protein
MERKRFSKSLALEMLDKRASRIAAEQKFDRSNGTSQLRPKGREFDAMIERAVEYGRMKAFEQFAEAICEGFGFDEA